MKINIPENLYNQLSERAKEKNFSNPEHYIVYLLEQIADKLDKTVKGQEKTISSAEELEIKERLKKLGYMH